MLEHTILGEDAGSEGREGPVIQIGQLREQSLQNGAQQGGVMGPWPREQSDETADAAVHLPHSEVEAVQVSWDVGIVRNATVHDHERRCTSSGVSRIVFRANTMLAGNLRGAVVPLLFQRVAHEVFEPIRRDLPELRALDESELLVVLRVDIENATQLVVASAFTTIHLATKLEKSLRLALFVCLVADQVRGTWATVGATAALVLANTASVVDIGRGIAGVAGIARVGRHDCFV